MLRQKKVAMREVQHPLVVGLELHREFRDIGTRRQCGRVVAVGTETSRGPNIKNGNGDFLKMAGEWHVSPAEQSVGVPICLHGEMRRDVSNQVSPHSRIGVAQVGRDYVLVQISGDEMPEYWAGVQRPRACSHELNGQIVGQALEEWRWATGCRHRQIIKLLVENAAVVVVDL